MLGWFGYQVQATGYEIQTAYGVSHLAEACSGIRSFHLALVGGLFLGAFMRLSFKRKVLLLVLCFATAYLVNVARVVALVSIMLHQHSQGAMELWHDRIGWGSQLGFIALMFVEAKLLSIFTWEPEAPPKSRASPGVIREALREAPRGHTGLLGVIILLAVGVQCAGRGLVPLARAQCPGDELRHRAGSWLTSCRTRTSANRTFRCWCANSFPTPMPGYTLGSTPTARFGN